MRSKRDKTQRRSDKRALTQNPLTFTPVEVSIYQQPKPVKPLRPLNDAQYDYLHSINTNVITFAVGPAGTGKTYIAASHAAELLVSGDIDRIVMSRPNVEAGKGFGFLPGELEEKYRPYMEPMLDVLNERLGKTHTEYLLKRGSIQFKPLEFMRGKTFSKCFYILDEAQNTTPAQMKLFLTRIGEDCKVIIDGDILQKDISGPSGLLDAVQRLTHLNKIGIVEFKSSDCVRSGMCRDILEAYENRP